MKAISIKSPWAHEILNGQKIYEFRTWSTKHRGNLLICSSASPKIEGMLNGYALAIVNLSNITQITQNNSYKFGVDDLEENERLFAWHLTNLRPIQPFKIKGKLNLYEVDDSLIRNERG